MTPRPDPLESALISAWNNSEPEGPACCLCGATSGPWVPTGDRWPSGAQKLACQDGCKLASLNEPVNGAAIRALFDAYTKRHSHMNAFACCSAHAVADAVPDLPTERAALLAEVEHLNALLREARAGEAVADGLTDCWKARVAELEAERDGVTEYGIRVPGIAWPEGGVLLDGNTFDRADQVARVERYRPVWPHAELVARTVARGAWAIAAPEVGEPS